MVSQVHTDVETDHRALPRLHGTSAKQLREKHSTAARLASAHSRGERARMRRPGGQGYRR